MCGGAGGGYGTIGNYNSYCGTTGRGPAFGSQTDAIVEQGGKGGNSPSGAVGGKGGGVIRLIGGTVNIAGQVTANGNNGAPSSQGAGGGGSGGGILIAGNSVTVSGTISAAPGAGGVSSGSSSYSGAAGGNGRIKILNGTSANVTGTLIGTVTQGLLPPLTISSSTHPDPNLIYNDDFSVIGLAWDRAFPSTQGYYHRTTTTQYQPPTPATGAFTASELLALDRTAVVAGQNYFHIAPVDAASAVGTVENRFRLQVNTTPPTVSSSSHPSETAWSANTNAFFSWTLPNADANHKGYYYVLDHYGDTVPPTTGPLLPVTQKQILLSNITSGIWAFHVV
ncbi:MAG: Endoglucanase, partial [Deltaproteobacteria bacterium]|nr:Endoglucanase [Deltaproteobacteria bacterium]